MYYMVIIIAVLSDWNSSRSGREPAYFLSSFSSCAPLIWQCHQCNCSRYWN